MCGVCACVCVLSLWQFNLSSIQIFHVLEGQMPRLQLRTSYLAYYIFSYVSTSLDFVYHWCKSKEITNAEIHFECL